MGALANYRKSIGLIERLLAKEPDRPQYIRQWVEAQRGAASGPEVQSHRLPKPGNGPGAFGALARGPCRRRVGGLPVAAIDRIREPLRESA